MNAGFFQHLPTILILLGLLLTAVGNTLGQRYWGIGLTFRSARFCSRNVKQVIGVDQTHVITELEIRCQLNCT